MSPKPKTLTCLNVSTAGYFLLLWICDKWEIQSGVLSFVAELLTMPMLLALFILLLLSARTIMGGNRPVALILSFSACLVTAVYIGASFL